jgi:anti-sigma B factor antagonist
MGRMGGGQRCGRADDAAGRRREDDVEIRERIVGSVVVFDLCGRLVLGDSEGCLTEAVHRRLSEGHSKFLLNCLGVSYVDSSGLGEVVESFVAVTGRGGRLVLAGVSRRLRLLLVTVGLLAVLEVRDDESEGLDSLRRRAPRGARGRRSSLGDDRAAANTASGPSRRCQGVVLLSA